MTFHTKSRKSHFERYATRADEAHFRLFIQKKIKAGTSDTKLEKQGSRKDLRSKAFWEEEEQWSERTFGFLFRKK